MIEGPREGGLIRSSQNPLASFRRGLLYEPQPGHFTFISWDLDRAFSRDHAFVTSMPSPRDLSIDCESDWGVDSKDGERSYLAPSCEVLIRALALRKSSEGLDLLLDGPFSVNEMHATIDWHAYQLVDAVERDSFVNKKGWLRKVKRLRATIVILRERMEELLAKNN